MLTETKPARGLRFNKKRYDRFAIYTVTDIIPHRPTRYLSDDELRKAIYPELYGQSGVRLFVLQKEAGHKQDVVVFIGVTVSLHCANTERAQAPSADVQSHIRLPRPKTKIVAILYSRPSVLQCNIVPLIITVKQSYRMRCRREVHIVHVNTCLCIYLVILTNAINTNSGSDDVFAFIAHVHTRNSVYRKGPTTHILW
jgi:hypothetical protein